MNRSQLAETLHELCIDEDDPTAMALAVFGGVVESQLDDDDLVTCDELATRAIHKAASFQLALNATSMTLVGLSRLADTRGDETEKTS